jgi:hypothetical protein
LSNKFTKLTEIYLPDSIKIIPDENQVTGLDITNILYINNVSIHTDEYLGTKGNLLLDAIRSEVYNLKAPIYYDLSIQVVTLLLQLIID